MSFNTFVNPKINYSSHEKHYKTMELTLLEIKERVDAYFRPRNKDEETLTEYTKLLVKKLEGQIGFTTFHQHIQLLLKTMIGSKGIETKDRWASVCQTITGNEAMWLLAIGMYLSPKQIEEWDDNTNI